jgi:transposase-like protein
MHVIERCWVPSPDSSGFIGTLLEKLYSVILFIAGLSLRDISERFCLTYASRESVWIWAHGFSSLFKPTKRARRLVGVDETVLKSNDRICYHCAAINADTGEILVIHASREKRDSECDQILQEGT